ncbi:CRISPR-associated protein Cas4 [Methanofollis formosanus]|uniref:CRISPR-associated exonuclease Cas4 n=1 Tax=Methanofollis formosanus TaxID=299308 RepID=A0A8G1A1U1_9EURY|nr:CRISPR-associated protein Cas4 [Methanofollis formosanus]QYZ78866.1 CRISPR-associated protein Cas4 [Methanofollis formosanus]
MNGKEQNVPVVSASEIAEYSYCALSWQFQRSRKAPDPPVTPSIERGRRVHAEVGRTLSQVEQERRAFWLLVIAGYALLALALIVLLGGIPVIGAFGNYMEVLALLAGATVFFVLALWKYRQTRTVREEFGIPEGELLYSDLDTSPEVLFSGVHRISGRPDYVLRDEMTGAYIPVEVKSGRARKPYWNHILQLAAYCLLVEEHYGTSVPYGTLVYGNAGQHRIEFTPELRVQVLATVDEIRTCLRDGTARRNHNAAVRCRSCAYRAECGYALRDE